MATAEAPGPATLAVLLDAIEKAGRRWMHIEKLEEINGAPGFNRTHGEDEALPLNRPARSRKPRQVGGRRGISRFPRRCFPFERASESLLSAHTHDVCQFRPC